MWHGASTDPRRWHPPNFVEFQTMCSQLPAVEIAWDLKQHVPHTLEMPSIPRRPHRCQKNTLEVTYIMMPNKNPTVPKVKQRFSELKKRANSNLQSLPPSQVEKFTLSGPRHVRKYACKAKGTPTIWKANIKQCSTGHVRTIA